MIDVLRIGIEIGLLYAPLALGVYLIMGVLSLPDLTVQGSFGIGGSVTIAVMLQDVNPLIAILAGVISGALTGLITAILHLWFHLNVLIAGIAMTTAAYSICLLIMGTGNLVYLGDDTVFDWAQNAGFSRLDGTILVCGIIAAVLVGGLYWFLGTEYGLSLRATGENIQTARGLGVVTERRQVAGFMIANALAACSGALVVQQQGFMDVGIQNGIIVIGLAALMIGRSLVPSRRVLAALLSVVLGILVYRVVVSFALDLGLSPDAIQLLEGGLVVILIAARLSAGRVRAAVASWRAGKRPNAGHQFYEDDKVAHFI